MDIFFFQTHSLSDLQYIANLDFPANMDKKILTYLPSQSTDCVIVSDKLVVFKN